MTSTSEMSNTYSRQVLRAGDIFRWKEAGEIPSSDESTQVQPVNGQRENVSKRRVIHIDYADIFGEMVLPELRQAGPKGSHANILPVPQPQVAPPPSPVYEQTIHGLTAESLKYFPRRRRGCSRLTARIIKNLAAEFEKLADDAPPDTNFLQVPTNTAHVHVPNNETKRNEMKTGLTTGGKSGTEQPMLRRKPIFKVQNDSTKSLMQDGDGSSCIIC